MIKKEIEELTRLISIEPDNSSHYYKRGILFGGKHISSKEGCETDQCYDSSKALADFDKAIELKPGCANAYYHKACIYFALDIDDEEAECLMEKAMELEPNNSSFILKYAEIITYNGENGDVAAELLEKVIAHDCSAENCMISAVYLLQHANYEFLVCNESKALDIYQKAMARLRQAIEKDSEHLERATELWSEFADECGYEHESIKNGPSLLSPQVCN